MSRRRPPPLLPKADLLAAINKSSPSQRKYPKAVHDGHVHLWATPRILDKLDYLRSAGEATASILSDHDSTRYLKSTSFLTDKGKTSFSAGTFVQTEVRHAVGQWDDAIDEVDWICSGQANQIPLKGIVPWAPLDEGPVAMQRYLEILVERVPESRPLIKGFRYLLQEFSSGSTNPMLQDGFIDSLVWMGSQGFIFDITIDAQHKGPAILEDVLECISRTYKKQGNGPKTVFVLDHLGKPDLSSIFSKSPRAFLDVYEQRMSELSLLPTLMIKYSGYLTLLPPEMVTEAFLSYIGGARAPHPSKAYSECKKALATFMTSIVEAFGEDRILWGSDWPVCKLALAKLDTSDFDKSAGDEERFWEFNYRLGLDALLELGLPDDALDKIFCTTAQTIYEK